MKTTCVVLFVYWTLDVNGFKGLILQTVTKVKFPLTWTLLSLSVISLCCFFFFFLRLSTSFTFVIHNRTTVPLLSLKKPAQLYYETATISSNAAQPNTSCGLWRTKSTHMISGAGSFFLFRSLTPMVCSARIAYAQCTHLCVFRRLAPKPIQFSKCIDATLIVAQRVNANHSMLNTISILLKSFRSSTTSLSFPFANMMRCSRTVSASMHSFRMQSIILLWILCTVNNNCVWATMSSASASQWITSNVEQCCSRLRQMWVINKLIVYFINSI